MFNIEQAVEQIIHSENPQNTFNKIAETLDDNWRTTLAREVNKHLFIENLANSDINQSIEFDVVETPTLTKQASEESMNTSKSSFLEKVAAYNDVPIELQLEKKAYITQDMFQLREEKYVTNNKIKSTAAGFGYMTKEASEKAEKELSLKQIEINKQKQLEKKAMIANLKMQRLESIEKIASLTNDPSQMRQILKVIIGQGMEKVAQEVINVSYLPSSEIEKVASVELDFDILRQVNKELDNIRNIEDSIEKVAFVGPLFRPLVKGLSITTSGTGKIVGGLTKGAVNLVSWSSKKIAEHPLAAIIVPAAYTAGDNASDEFTYKLTGLHPRQQGK
jgi:hypothetical protein